AEDPALSDARTALRRHLAVLMADSEILDRVHPVCLEAALKGELPHAWIEAGDSCLARAPVLASLLRHAPVVNLLAAEAIAGDRRAGRPCAYLERLMPRSLVEAVAEQARADERCRAHLLRLLAGPGPFQPMAASLLHAVDGNWKPDSGRGYVLDGAYLAGGRWAGVELPAAPLHRADLAGGRLTRRRVAGAHPAATRA